MEIHRELGTGNSAKRIYFSVSGMPDRLIAVLRPEGSRTVLLTRHLVHLARSECRLAEQIIQSVVICEQLGTTGVWGADINWRLRTSLV